MKNTKIVEIDKSKITLVKLKEDWNIIKKQTSKPKLTLDMVDNDTELYNSGLKLKQSGYSDIEIIRLIEDFRNFETLYQHRFYSIKKNQVLSNLFYSNGRNSIWDNFKKKSGLYSKGSIDCDKSQKTDEHFIPRKITSQILYTIRDSNKLCFLDYVELYELLSKTIVLSKFEHSKITTKTRNTNIPSFIIYETENIEILGLKEYLNNVYIRLKSKFNFDLFEYFGVEPN